MILDVWKEAVLLFCLLKADLIPDENKEIDRFWRRPFDSLGPLVKDNYEEAS